jgi:acyl-CoA synthetase (NDP forming)
VLAKLSRQTREKLAPLVPSTGTMNNPVDLTFSKNPQDYFTVIPDILLEEGDCDGLLAYFLAPGPIIRRAMEGMGIAADQIPQLTEKLFDDQGKSLAGLIAKHQKPLFGFTFQSHDELYVQKLLDHGVPVFPSPDRAARAMAALVDYSRLVDKIKSNT